MATNKTDLTAGDVEMDTVAKQVWRKGQRLKLKPREYQLLEYLIHRRGEVVTQEEIEEHLYDDGTELVSNVIESILSSLRQAIWCFIVTTGSNYVLLAASSELEKLVQVSRPSVWRCSDTAGEWPSAHVPPVCRGDRHRLCPDRK